MTRTTPTERRPTLTRQRVLEAAIQLADREGIDALSMRRLGQALGIEAMSLYTHVRSKEDLLDGMVEVVMSEVPSPTHLDDWKASLRETILEARSALLRHPWAPALIETRVEPGMAMMAHFDRVMGILRRGGFSVEATHHALHLLGSRALGFTQELFDDSPEMDADQVAAFADRLRPLLPYVAEMAVEATHDGGLGGCDTNFEFAWSLDLMLNGLERVRDEPRPPAISPGSRRA